MDNWEGWVYLGELFLLLSPAEPHYFISNFRGIGTFSAAPVLTSLTWGGAGLVALPFTPQHSRFIFYIFKSNIYAPHPFRRFDSQSQELGVFALLPSTEHNPWHASALKHLLN